MRFGFPNTSYPESKLAKLFNEKNHVNNETHLNRPNTLFDGVFDLTACMSVPFIEPKDLDIQNRNNSNVGDSSYNEEQQQRLQVLLTLLRRSEQELAEGFIQELWSMRELILSQESSSETKKEIDSSMAHSLREQPRTMHTDCGMHSQLPSNENKVHKTDTTTQTNQSPLPPLIRITSDPQPLRLDTCGKHENHMIPSQSCSVCFPLHRPRRLSPLARIASTKPFRGRKRRPTRRNTAHHMIGNRRCIYHPIKLPIIELPKRWEICMWNWGTYTQPLSILIKNQHIALLFIDNTANEIEHLGLGSQNFTAQQIEDLLCQVYCFGSPQFINRSTQDSFHEPIYMNENGLKCGDQTGERTVQRCLSVLDRMPVMRKMSRESSNVIRHGESFELNPVNKIKNRAITWKSCRSGKSEHTDEVKKPNANEQSEYSGDLSSLDSLNILSVGSCQSAFQTESKEDDSLQDSSTTNTFYHKAGVWIQTPVRPSFAFPYPLRQDSTGIVNVANLIYPDAEVNVEEHDVRSYDMESQKSWSLGHQEKNQGVHHLSSPNPLSSGLSDILSKQVGEKKTIYVSSKTTESTTTNVGSLPHLVEELPSNATATPSTWVKKRKQIESTASVTVSSSKLIQEPNDGKMTRLNEQTDQVKSTVLLSQSVSASPTDFSKSPVPLSNLTKRNPLSTSQLETLRPHRTVDQINLPGFGLANAVPVTNIPENIANMMEKLQLVRENSKKSSDYRRKRQFGTPADMGSDSQKKDIQPAHIIHQEMLSKTNVHGTLNDQSGLYQHIQMMIQRDLKENLMTRLGRTENVRKGADHEARMISTKSAYATSGKKKLVKTKSQPLLNEDRRSETRREKQKTQTDTGKKEGTGKNKLEKETQPEQSRFADEQTTGKTKAINEKTQITKFDPQKFREELKKFGFEKTISEQLIPVMRTTNTPSKAMRKNEQHIIKYPEQPKRNEKKNTTEKIKATLKLLGVQTINTQKPMPSITEPYIKEQYEKGIIKYANTQDDKLVGKEEKKIQWIEAIQPFSPTNADQKKPIDSTRQKNKGQTGTAESEASVSMDSKSRKPVESKAQTGRPEDKQAEQKRAKPGTTGKPDVSVVGEQRPTTPAANVPTDVKQSESQKPLSASVTDSKMEFTMEQQTVTSTSSVKPTKDGEKYIPSTEAIKPFSPTNADQKKPIDSTRQKNKGQTGTAESEASVSMDSKSRKPVESKAQTGRPEDKQAEQKRAKPGTTGKPDVSVPGTTGKPDVSVVGEQRPTTPAANVPTDVKQSESQKPLSASVTDSKMEFTMEQQTVTSTSSVKPTKDGEKYIPSTEAIKPFSPTNADQKKPIDSTRQKNKGQTGTAESEASVSMDSKSRKPVESKAQTGRPEDKQAEQKRAKPGTTGKPDVSVVGEQRPTTPAANVPTDVKQSESRKPLSASVTDSKMEFTMEQQTVTSTSSVKPTKDGEKYIPSTEAIKPFSPTNADQKKPIDSTRQKNKGQTGTAESEASVSMDSKSRKPVESTARIDGRDATDSDHLFSDDSAMNFAPFLSVVREPKPLPSLPTLENDDLPAVIGPSVVEPPGFSLPDSPSNILVFPSDFPPGQIVEGAESRSIDVSKSPSAGLPDSLFSKLFNYFKRRVPGSESSLGPSSSVRAQIEGTDLTEPAETSALPAADTADAVEDNLKPNQGPVSDRSPSRLDLESAEICDVADDAAKRYQPWKNHPKFAHIALPISALVFARHHGKFDPNGGPVHGENLDSSLVDQEAGFSGGETSIEKPQTSSGVTHRSKIWANYGRHQLNKNKESRLNKPMALKEKLGRKVDTLMAAFIKSGPKFDETFVSKSSIESEELSHQDQIPTSNESVPEKSPVSPTKTTQVITDGSVSRPNSVTLLSEALSPSLPATQKSFSEISLGRSSQQSGDMHLRKKTSHMTLSQRTSVTGITTKSDDSSDSEFQDNFLFEKNYQLPPY
ncbi:hypothetical protein FBUS_04350 [Fasciolopsis buskii]|uniref:Uncharacterized protein n=1 Tax=Fasciolopsis buskii TaxID=27845 RepID=A0A8E0RNI0_9TREM|nr:hypothetical protein FBUS_04350 [Fasciolopsis buski]